MATENDIHHTWGLKRFMRIFEGISNKTYGTKKIVRAIFGCTPERCRSLGRLRTRALDILTLWRVSGQQGNVYCAYGNSPVEKRSQVNNEQDWQYSKVYSSHQSPLVDRRGTLSRSLWRFTVCQLVRVYIIVGRYLWAAI